MQGVEIIKEFAKNAPSSPGVYRMLDEKHEILYIGKAKNLKNRITNYTNIKGLVPRIQKMVSNTAKMEVTTTKTESEALLLEANLIKHHQPRYNIELKDNKSFPYIAIDHSHDFPRIFKHRGEKKKNITYFGPYASAGDVNKTIAVLQRSFLVRPCSDSVFKGRTRPCLEYQIKRCSAPCVKYVGKEEYGDLIKEAEDFLSGRSRDIQDVLEKKMTEASKEKEYERAAIFRDRIKALTQIQNKQYINASTVSDADVVALYKEGDKCCIQVFFFRGGQSLGNKPFYPKRTEGFNEEEILEAFLGRFYQTNPAPKEIILANELYSSKVLEVALTNLYNHSVKLIFPQKGEKQRLVALAKDNAKESLKRKINEDENQQELMTQLAEVLGIDEPPKRIEVFDNSHISGRHAVGAMIVSGPEGFIKNSYRKFNIKDMETTPGDDYAMMREVLTRRYSRLKKEYKEGDENWPDLVLIDGGPGHLSVSKEVFDDLGLSNMPYVCIAKGPDRNAGREKFYQDGKAPFQLEKNHPVLFYLQRLRDEAHRYVIMSHRSKRSREVIRSKLDDIEGIGAVKKKALLHHFGTATAVEKAGIEDLAKVEGISIKLAEQIYNQLH